MTVAVCAAHGWTPPRVERCSDPALWGCAIKRGLLRFDPTAPICVVAHELAHPSTFPLDHPDRHGQHWERLYADLLVTVHRCHLELA